MRLFLCTIFCVVGLACLLLDLWLFFPLSSSHSEAPPALAFSSECPKGWHRDIDPHGVITCDSPLTMIQDRTVRLRNALQVVVKPGVLCTYDETTGDTTCRVDPEWPCAL